MVHRAGCLLSYVWDNSVIVGGSRDRRDQGRRTVLHRRGSPSVSHPSAAAGPGDNTLGPLARACSPRSGGGWFSLHRGAATQREPDPTQGVGGTDSRGAEELATSSPALVP